MRVSRGARPGSRDRPRCPSRPAGGRPSRRGPAGTAGNPDRLGDRAGLGDDPEPRAAVEHGARPSRTTSWSSTTSSVSGRFLLGLGHRRCSPRSRRAVPPDGRISIVVPRARCRSPSSHRSSQRGTACSRDPGDPGRRASPVKPCPLSVDDELSPPPVAALDRRRCARVAPECRATLLRASLTRPRRCVVGLASGSVSKSADVELGVDHRVVAELLDDRDEPVHPGVGGARHAAGGAAGRRRGPRATRGAVRRPGGRRPLPLRRRRLPAGTTLRRAVGAGELLPRGALGAAGAGALTEVPLSVDTEAVPVDGPGRVDRRRLGDARRRRGRQAGQPAAPRWSSTTSPWCRCRESGTSLGPTATRQVIVGVGEDQEGRLPTSIAALSAGDRGPHRPAMTPDGGAGPRPGARRGRRVGVGGGGARPHRARARAWC